ncbi:MAG: hypothetical protein FRX49_00935 [Trebouxia sp. A1-2]|nr:MAG: hypothetical protein FRX49_00935 [Trebouxia sp. A1-2]
MSLLAADVYRQQRWFALQVTAGRPDEGDQLIMSARGVLKQALKIFIVNFASQLLGLQKVLGTLQGSAAGTKAVLRPGLGFAAQGSTPTPLLSLPCFLSLLLGQLYRGVQAVSQAKEAVTQQGRAAVSVNDAAWQPERLLVHFPRTQVNQHVVESKVMLGDNAYSHNTGMYIKEAT